MLTDLEWIGLLLLAILFNEVMVRVLLGKTTFVLIKNGLTKAKVKVVEMTPDNMIVATATHFVFIMMLSLMWGSLAFIIGVEDQIFVWFVIPIVGLFVSFAFLANRAHAFHL